MILTQTRELSPAVTKNALKKSQRKKTAIAKDIIVTANRWAHSWELIIDEDNATRVRPLAKAQQIRAIVADLQEEGISQGDTAAILGASKSRVQQLQAV